MSAGSSRRARRLRACLGRLRRFLLTAPAEDDPAEGEAEAERAEGERTYRDRLAPLGEPLPAREDCLLLGRQRLAAPALPNRTARAQAEVEIVEELGRLVHAMSV